MRPNSPSAPPPYDGPITGWDGCDARMDIIAYASKLRWHLNQAIAVAEKLENQCTDARVSWESGVPDLIRDALADSSVEELITRLDQECEVWVSSGKRKGDSDERD